MAAIDRLIEEAKKAARAMGGLLALLLAVKSRTDYIKYSTATARFTVHGKEVGLRELRVQLGKFESRVATRIIDYNNKLWTGTWTVTHWRREMEKLFDNSHLIFGALALGSVAAAAADPTVTRRRARDAAALARFATAIKNGGVPSLPVMQNRGRAYVRSFRVTYELLNHSAHILAGYTEAKRVLTPAEHCRNRVAPGGVQEGCYEAALRSWMPIAEMPPIGTLVCGQFCLCYLIYR